MAKTKKSTGKRKKKKVKKDAYVQAIFVIIFSLLLAVLIYGKTGSFGRGLSTTLGGIMGWIKYLVPIGTFIVGIILTKEQKEFVIPKLVQFMVIILCICGTMSLGKIYSKELDINDEFGEIISSAFEDGESNKGGGALGALIAIPMNKAIGAASYVVLIGTGILLSIFTFGIKPAELIDRMSEKMQERRDEEEDDEDEEEEEQIIEERRPPKRVKERPKKQRSVIMENLFDDDEETLEKKKYDHDIPLAFDARSEKEEIEDVKPKVKQKEEIKEEPKEEYKEDYIEANLFKEKKEEKEEKTKQELQLEHSQIEIDENYEFPPVALLEPGTKGKETSKTLIAENASRLQKTLHSFGVAAKVEDVAVGPAITRYEIKPAEGVRVNKIANLADDIALNLAAQSIRIEAPIPRKTGCAVLKYLIRIQKWCI